jgi:AcrR family transcriptional regulator
MTKPATTRRMSGPDRRRQILDVALEAFAARGYAGTSMREIAAAAGVTKPVLYLHFASKERLYVALLEEISGALTRGSADAMGADAPARERVRAAIAAFFAYAEERPAAVRVLLASGLGDAELEREAARIQRQVTARLRDLLAADPGLWAGAPDRERRLEMAVEFTKTGVHGLAEWWSTNPEVGRETLVDAVMALVWDGLAEGFEVRSRGRA